MSGKKYMNKTLNLLLISLTILTISCSSSPDVMDTTIDKQKQLDKDKDGDIGADDLAKLRSTKKLLLKMRLLLAI